MFANYFLWVFKPFSGRDLLRNPMDNIVGEHRAFACNFRGWWFWVAAYHPCVTSEPHQGIPVLRFPRARVMVCSCIPHLNAICSFSWLFGMKRLKHKRYQKQFFTELFNHKIKKPTMDTLVKYRFWRFLSAFQITLKFPGFHYEFGEWAFFLFHSLLFLIIDF